MYDKIKVEVINRLARDMGGVNDDMEWSIIDELNDEQKDYMFDSISKNFNGLARRAKFCTYLENYENISGTLEDINTLLKDLLEEASCLKEAVDNCLGHAITGEQTGASNSAYNLLDGMVSDPEELDDMLVTLHGQLEQLQI